jgi:hypothetical protein
MPKQIHLDKAGGKLYWCDREGMRGRIAIIGTEVIGASWTAL